MPTLQASPFLERLLAFLIPYFLGFSADLAAARAEALETLASYGARTRAELICAVQIILFSFAALDTLAAANMPEMSPSMRLRFRGCANNLNRSSQKTEQALAKRLAADDARPHRHKGRTHQRPTRPRGRGNAPADPGQDRRLPQPGIRQPPHSEHAGRTPSRPKSAAQLQSDNHQPSPVTLRKHQARHSETSRPAHAEAAKPSRHTNAPIAKPAQNQSILLTQQEQNKRLWGAAMMDTLAQMGMPVKPALGPDTTPTPRR